MPACDFCGNTYRLGIAELFADARTFTLATESGVACRAAGLIPEHVTRGGSWNRRNRARDDKAPTCRKTRWARLLAPPRRSVA